MALHVDWLRVSLYDWNRQAVQTLKERFGKKVHVIDSRRHWDLPSGPYGTEVLPADCVGPGYLVFDRYVYPCCNVPATPLGLGTSLEDIPRCRIQPGFIEALLPLRGRLDPFCQACIGNRKVQSWLK